MVEHHDPIPDGRSGWALREPHLKNEHGAIGETFDPRCAYCAQHQQDLLDAYIDQEDERIGFGR